MRSPVNNSQSYPVIRSSLTCNCHPPPLFVNISPNEIDTISLPKHPTTANMPPIALGTKHQDLLKAYIQVSKTSGADWTTIATKADYPTSKYARDQWALVKSKLLATDNGTAINLADRQIALLKATLEVMKTEVSFPHRNIALLVTLYSLMPCRPTGRRSRVLPT